MVKFLVLQMDRSGNMTTTPQPVMVSTQPAVITTQPAVISPQPAVAASPTPEAATAPAACDVYVVPWPVVIISVLGAIIIIYTAAAPGVDQNRRVFGIILMILWTLIWILLLWVLWRECHQAATWWLLLIAVTAMILFFVLIIIQNVGSSI